MKKIMTIAFGSALTMMATAGCSSEKSNMYFGSKKLSGEIVAQTIETKGFDKINIKGYPTIYYTQGAETSVVVKADKAIIDDIVISVEDNVLIVDHESSSTNGFVINSGNMSDAMSIYVTSPDIKAVTLSGAGDFISKKKINTDQMDILIKGSGDIDIASIVCGNISASLNGSGDIDIDAADAQNASIDLMGSGDIDIKLANAKTTNINLMGSGDIDVDFINGGSVNATLMGSGDIELEGNIESLTKNEAGSGDIDTSKLKVARIQ